MITNFILFCLVKKSKLYIPGTTNTQKKLLSRAIWACFWQTSSNLEDYNNLDFTILNCKSQFKMHLHPKNLKSKEKKVMVYYSTTPTSKMSVFILLGIYNFEKSVVYF